MIKSRKQRIAPKERRILLDLRQQIVQGKFPPGTRLPRREELEEHFCVSPLTLRRALDRLTDDGFIYSKTGQGTFVTDKPPHLSRYGVVFPTSPEDPARWSNFYEALNHEALAIHRSGLHNLSLYYGVENPFERKNYDRAVSDVQAHRLAGLFFVSPPFVLHDSPLLTEPNMPRVAIGLYREIQGIALNSRTFLTKAIQLLKQRGRQRVALIAGGITIDDHHCEDFKQILQLHGMQTRSSWIHSVTPNSAPWAKSLAELICEADASTRPDGLLIFDDNLVPYATAGVLAAGLRVPDHIDIIAHANFPCVTPSMVPAKRLGFHARVILEQAISMIDTQRKGIPGPLRTDISAMFEDELVPLAV